MWEKNRVLLNVTKVQIDVMLVLPNVTMKPSNVRKKKKEPPNVTKEVTRDVRTAQCEGGIVKYEKKNKENHQM